MGAWWMVQRDSIWTRRLTLVDAVKYYLTLVIISSPRPIKGGGWPEKMALTGGKQAEASCSSHQRLEWALASVIVRAELVPGE